MFRFRFWGLGFRACRVYLKLPHFRGSFKGSIRV